ncbi:MAG: ATP-binding protein [Patescibacteria group bacterium]
MNYQLLTHNILFLFGGVLNIVLPLAVIFVRRKKLDALIVTFALTSLSIAVFQISQVFGVMAPDAESSRQIFMFNISMMPINIFMAHWFLLLIGKAKQRRPILTLIYTTGIILFLIHLIFPETYLVASVPKMYFPFYYEPGPLQWVTRLWFNLVGAYYFAELAWAYRHENDPVKKNRYLYVLIAILYAFIVGSTAILLVYDIQFDPMWASLFGFFPLIIAYAVVRYQLLEVRFIIQRAFIYGLTLAVLVGFISFSNALTYFLQSIIPGFPIWAVPLASSIIGVFIGVFFWNKLRESDLLKYEFITIIAHKFRTPLTQAKWTLEEMIAVEDNSEKKASLSNLHDSSNKLIDLTGALVELTDTDRGGGGQYTFETMEVCPLVQGMVSTFKPAFDDKHILLTLVCGSPGIQAHIDKKRMQFVIQTLLENAAAYTPEGGKVTVHVFVAGSKAHIAVTDSGIGIAREDMSRVFSKFYRTKLAKSVDTEGFGVGLYLAQSIARRHGGKIEISSEGEGKGSTFSVVLPAILK